MFEHPAFRGLLLHSDEELGEAVGVGVLSRKAIHEWPLSCVQEVRLADGGRLVYKTQLPPTVEIDFYGRASSPLLPGHRALGRLGDCETMTVEWVDAPPLRRRARSEADLVAHGRRLVDEIGRIGGQPRAYLDIGSVSGWSSATGEALDKLAVLVRDGRFPSVDLDAVGRVRAWAASAQILATIAERPRLVHGDLTAAQVFVAADGYRVVDWQRPVLTHPDVDLVTLLVDRHIDPAPHAAPEVIGVYWFLRLHWAVRAQHDLFPDRGWPLFDGWAAEAVRGMLRG